jgi:hypothetical protein
MGSVAAVCAAAGAATTAHSAQASAVNAVTIFTFMCVSLMQPFRTRQQNTMSAAAET